MTPDPTHIGGEKFWPLSVEQRDAFRDAAIEANSAREKLTGLTLVHTGLRNAEFHHMRRRWLEYDDAGEPRIVVPREEICTGGSGATGEDNASGANLHERGEPCFRCRNSTPDWVGAYKNREDGKDFHDPQKWFPKTFSSGARPLPLNSLDESGETTDILEWWFEGNEEIPLTHASVNRKIRRIADRAGIDRKVTAHDLRNTFATDLARNSVDRRHTAKLMGHASTDATDPYYKFVGADLKSELRDKLG